MTTITNPALFSYKLGVSKYGLFKKVPFMIAYWEKDNGFQYDLDPMFNENNFICYVVFRAKDLGTISKHSKLLIGDMHKIDMKSIYTLPVKDYTNAKPVLSSSHLGEFYTAYETLKSCLISALVNYEDMFE